jgi:ligand-binding sensor domain-containing protein
LWIGTENGVSTMQNGEFSIINESNGLGHNSCWDIFKIDGNMWFASYGGVSVSLMGKSFTVLLLSRPTCEQDKEGFSF